MSAVYWTHMRNHKRHKNYHKKTQNNSKSTDWFWSCMLGLSGTETWTDTCWRLKVKTDLTMTQSDLKRFKSTVLSWPVYDPRFLPASQDHRYRQRAGPGRAGPGITAFCPVLTTGRFHSFEDLWWMFEPSKEDFCRYLQTQHGPLILLSPQS